MNERENIIKAFRGEVPEWVPNYNVASQYLSPEALNDPNYKLYALYEEYKSKGEEQKVKMKDAFGITWVLDDHGPITEPGNNLLEDITEWREKFTIPDLTDFDWDASCERDKAVLVPDKMVQIAFTGVFMTLVNAMGYEGALISLAMEPEECMAFFDAVSSFQSEIVAHVLPRIHCDSIQIGDDMASSKNLMMSPDTYRKLIKPYHKKVIDTAKKYQPDIIVEFHCCGYCTEILDDFLEIGVQVWQPAQPMNDLKAIHKKYGRNLVINGAWDAVGLTCDRSLCEEDIRKSVRDTIDEFGKDGGYVFWNGGPVGSSKTVSERLNWADDEANKYGKEFYKVSSII